ncbi:MAG: tetratricopeptide repeat protein, partial [Verrucomicrobiota bacterium]
EQGNPDAEITLGSLYGRGRGVPRSLAMAIQWYRKAAEQGNALAQFAMGNFYSSGRGVTNDMVQAIRWWQKAADQNQVEAQAALGELYLTPSVEHGASYLNFPESLHWLRAAATDGSARAMNDLGVAYQSGLGVKLDLKEAAKWFRLAAERGDAQAQANLGQLYFDGSGVPLDLAQAYKWFKLSSNQNNNHGTIGFNNFQAHQLLKPQQLTEAEQMVFDFKPIPPTN